MSNRPTSGFVDISTALSFSGVVGVVIGVVVDVFGGVFQSSRSYCITFTVKDSNFENGHVWDGLKIKYFKENASLLPPVQVHDVILLRNISIRRFGGRPLGVAPDGSNIPWAIFRPESHSSVTSLSPISGPVPFEPSHSESTYALSLIEKISGIRTFRSASSQHAAPPNTHSVPSTGPTSKSNGNRKFALIHDIEEKTFVDLTGEIVKIYYNESERVALYLTDYTTNEKLYNYVVGDVDSREGDEYGYQQRSMKKWSGPAGRRTLQITLWEPHASFARQNLHEGDIVRLRNVHIKRSRVEGSPLEASLHGDRQNPKQVNISKCDAERDERGQELLRRRDEYWASDSRKREAEPEEASSGHKKAKLNRKKKDKSKKARQEEGQVTLSLNSKYKPNGIVEAAHTSIDYLSIEDILGNDSYNNVSPDGVEYRFPFQNFCYRSTVRVVDYFPPNIEDFAVPDLSEPRWQQSPSSESQRPAGTDSFTRWTWRFCLLIESVPPPPRGQPKERMKLFVSGADAEYLLRTSATDLRKNRSKLNLLREKLFHLWGDLEERKAEAATKGTTLAQNSHCISSVPFACCIKEYGVKCGHDAPSSADDLLGCSLESCFGWERRFAMFMTTIHA